MGVALQGISREHMVAKEYNVTRRTDVMQSSLPPGTGLPGGAGEVDRWRRERPGGSQRVRTSKAGVGGNTAYHVRPHTGYIPRISVHSSPR